MKITKQLLRKHNACQECVKWFLKQKKTNHEFIINKLMKKNHFDWANWLIVRLMTRKQKIRYAIFAAEQVIDIWEKKYPDDKRPREAIEAAKKVLKKNSKKNRNAADTAAKEAADSTDVAYVAANHVAADSTIVAKAAAYVAADTADDVTDAARVAAKVAVRAAANATEKKNMQESIIKHGLTILEE